MSDKTFVPGTVVDSPWLNDVNDAIYHAIGNGTTAPLTPADVRTNLGITGSAAAIVNTISALRNVSHLASTTCTVLGYYAAGDKGGGIYYYDASDTTSADNGGTIIVASDLARWKLINTGSVSILQFGCDPTGVADSSDQLIACLAACTDVYVPEGLFKVTKNIPVPASRKMRGAGKSVAKFDKQTNSDIFLLTGWYFDWEDIGAEMNGNTYATGSLWVASANTNYHKFYRFYLNNYKAPVYKNTAAEAGNQSAWVSGEVHPVASALFTPAFQFSSTKDLGAANRRFIDCNAQGGQLLDFAASVETYLVDCFTNGFTNTSLNADLCKISNCRCALVGTPQYILGQGFNISSSDFPGPVILRNSGTNALTYRNNTEHSLSWGNGKYNNIDMILPYKWVQNAGGSAGSVGTGGVTIGSTILPVADSSLYQVGQYVEVQTGTFWRSIIDGIEATTTPQLLYLRTPAPQAYSAGDVVARFFNIICDGNLSTTCTQLTPGAYTVTVASATGLAAGRMCLVQNAGRGADNILTVITNVSGTTITLADPIENPSGISGVAFIAQGPPLDFGVGGNFTMQVTRSGNRATCAITAQVGSSGTNFGSTSWQIWLPAISHPQVLQPLSMIGFDNSAATAFPLRGNIGTGLPFVSLSYNATTVNNAVPYSWANNDTLQGTITYQCW